MPGVFSVSAGARPLAELADNFFGVQNAYHPNELYASMVSHQRMKQLQSRPME